MPDIKILNIEGAEVGSLALKAEVFDAPLNKALIHQVIVAQLANKRQGTKSTLTRSEVRGGGKKPWRQKGTGRARQGSIRAPQWTKGGIVFAPKPRDFSKKVNKKMKMLALASALSVKLRDEELVVLDNIAFDTAKTKLAVKMLDNLKADKKALIVVANSDENIMRATNNLSDVTLMNSDLINVYDIMRNNKCIFTVDAIKKIEEAYTL